MGFPRSPEEFLQYFERVSREYPDVQHWADGVAVAKQWQALSRQEQVLQPEVDEFLDRLRAETNPGTGWTELGWQFACWAEQRGFRV